MIYITGDTHSYFERLYTFYKIHGGLTKEDIIIVLGDAGINYHGGRLDRMLKEQLKGCPFTLFCIHGNHEMRPSSSGLNYIEKEWNGGIIYVEEKYPNILFAKDGEIFKLEGQNCIAIGGAYSIDKYHRLSRGLHWFSDEQPSEEIRKYVESKLESVDWKVDIVLSHTCPAKYMPTERFLTGYKNMSTLFENVPKKYFYEQI